MNHCVRENSVYYEVHLQEIKKVLTEFEFSVYILRVLKCTPVNVIATRYHCETKSVYNAVHRAKLKIHRYFED
jgi:DNA-directed RNA polymerase specialized sigma24 family protein